jgi:RNA polymerase sigma factor (sigma-70 family)
MQVTTDLVLETLAATESTIRARFGRRLSRMNQRYDLDDLCQDVAIKAVNGADGCRAETMEELRHWILTIAKYTCETQVTRHLGTGKRSLRVEAVVVGQATDESRDGYQPATGDCEGLEAAVIREEVEQAYAMLDRLWAPRKTALLMRLVDGASDEEIAEKLGVTQQNCSHNGIARVGANRSAA